MNIAQIVEQLKFVPDQQLGPMTQGGAIPGYLVVAEMQRRASLRKSATASNANSPENRTTVKQEMQQAAMPMPMQMAAPSVSQASGIQAVGRYAGGGMVGKYSGGGNVFGLPWMDVPTQPRATPPFAPAQSRAQLEQMYPRTTIDQIKQQFEKFRSPNELVAEAEKFKQEEEMYRNRKTKLGDILMSLGLGMAASRRPDAMGAIAEGGINALNSWQQERGRNQSLADRAAGQRAEMLAAIQRSKDIETREMGALYRAAVAADNVNIGTVEANNRALAAQAAAADRNNAALALRERIAQAEAKATADKGDADRAFDIWKIKQQGIQQDKTNKSREKAAIARGSKANKSDRLDPLTSAVWKSYDDLAKATRALNPMLPAAAIDKAVRAALKGKFTQQTLNEVLPPELEDVSVSTPPAATGGWSNFFNFNKMPSAQAGRRFMGIEAAGKGMPVIEAPPK